MMAYPEQIKMNHIKKIIKELRLSVINSLPVKVANQLPLGALTNKQRWSIGIYIGESPVDLATPKNVKNPVLTRRDVTDVRAEFVADPFMLKVEQSWVMFFEVLNQQPYRGEIGLATSEDGMNWKYQQIVLAEPFHLSYPYIFEWMNDYYMIPETNEANAIRLYKASHFPSEWCFIGNLLTGLQFSDASIFHYAGKWWLFTETNPQGNFDTLRLYYAEELLGPWLEHPKSPIVEGDAHIARPGGRVVVTHSQIIRYAQDCEPEYGTQVRAFEITELTTTTYQEREISQSLLLSPTGSGWNGAGMHHIDPHFINEGKWIACVDGRG